MLKVNVVNSRGKLAMLLAFVILAIPVVHNSVIERNSSSLRSIAPNLVTQVFRASVTNVTQVRIYQGVGDYKKPGLLSVTHTEGPLVILENKDASDFVDSLHFQDKWITDLKDSHGDFTPPDDAFVTSSAEFYRGNNEVADLRIGYEGNYVRWYTPTKWQGDGHLQLRSQEYFETLLMKNRK